MYVGVERDGLSVFKRLFIKIYEFLKFFINILLVIIIFNLIVLSGMVIIFYNVI